MVDRRPWPRGPQSCLFFLPILLFHEFFQLRSMVPKSIDVRTASTLLPAEALLQQTPGRSNVTSTEYMIHNILGKGRKLRVLIAQYASCHPNDSYSMLLKATSRVNRAYASHWGYDYTLLRGTPYVAPYFNESFSLQRFEPGNGTMQTYGTDCSVAADNVPASRATYNKLMLLSVVRTHPEFQNRYDRLLILDADAMMYDFGRDIGTWESDRAFVVAAHRTQETEPSGTGSINVGVTLWNLNHKLTPFIVERWKQECLWRIQENRPDDDQAPLQILLKDALDLRKRHQVVYAITGEFEYGRGTFVRHNIRKHMQWNTTTSINEVRLSKIWRNMGDICHLHDDIFSFCDKESLSAS